ncbi:MAG TPA: circularly permuted type 2 ATP-grasp protein [Mycobacteriales bacterium]|nr:circularly permuted type 2 ATP-grasp protein [Mycobacteriales bacterium]
MVDADGNPWPHTKSLYEALQLLSPSDLSERGAARARSFLEQGITFSSSGREWVFPLDLIPRLIPEPEWEHIEAGVAQRVRALEAFLADVYGERQVLADRVVPHSLVVTSANFQRAAAGIRPANGVRVHLAGIDLVRGADGVMRVLEDNLRVPSGISYVVENREALTRVFPGLFLEQQVQPVAGYVSTMLDALRAAAPAGVDDPTVVLLTPGVHNSAYFEHAFLARKMGIELVEGRDLVCQDNVLFMRTTRGQQRVDVVYRRVDDDWLDPVQFRPESVIGCPGLVNAARAGNVTIANALGNGVADDKLTYTYVPAMIDYYLGEQPLLPNVPTYRLDDADVRADCLARADQLVFKPVDGSGGHGIVIGPQATEEELAEVSAGVRARPRAWIAQELVVLSTVPSQDGDRLRPRHVDLRPFATNDGERVHVLPGGLTRVALREGSLVVNSSQGGGSKDTWVLTSRPDRPVSPDSPLELLPMAVPADAPDPGPGIEQQPQQQQAGPC